MSGLFHAFCRYFRVLHPWVWTGEAVTPGAGQILDGAAHRGQCLALARAFRALAIQSFPFGLGLSEARVQLDQYGGLNNAGFVSRHGDNTQLGTVLGLRSNVYAAPHPEGVFTPVTAGLHPNDLYLWENHKTIAYGGLYYDVLYGRIWDRTDQMALYNLRPPEVVRVETNPATNHTVTTTYTPATNATGTLFYFRSLTEPEVIAIQRRGFQGPFSTLPGTAWDGKAEGNVGFLRNEYLDKVRRLNK
ncbi:MAG: hypothetical protein ABSE42_01470 [Bryobacteraceae bacterium]